MIQQRLALCLVLLLAAGWLGTSTTIAQASLITQDPLRFQRFAEARQWFTDEQYKLAYPVFKELEMALSTESDINRQLYAEELRFYKLACELMENNPAGAAAADQYMASNAATVHKGQLGFYLGSYHFRQQQYPLAIAAFEKASISHLNNNQVAAMQFEQGYSYFTQKQFTNAKPLLNSVRQSKQSPYWADANYYYGLLAFNDGNYRDALEAFEVVRYHKKYQTMVPYYMAGINYAIGQKDKAMQQAEEALKSGQPFYKPELQQLVGHGYFEKRDYKKALPYLEGFVASASKVKREDLYELAYCYYIDGNYNKAIEQFKPLAGGQDSLSQHAMYLLGDAYLKTNQKNNARNAFLFCSSNSSNAQFKEISLFNYGKLSYELGYDAEALPALKQYVANYPAGKYSAEAKDLLVGVLGNTSNYKEALELYESLPNKSEVARKYYPAIAFNRAQELMNDRNLATAEPLLQKVLGAPFNSTVAPLAQFWLAEIDFGKEQYASAVQRYQNYLATPITAGEANPQSARYGLAYSLLRLQQYKEAGKLFNELSNANWPGEQQRTDVQLRAADCWYMQKEFGKALPVYSQVAGRRAFGSDYAQYQMGMIAGAQNKPAEKINTLRTLESLYPASTLVGMANMEIANTYLADEKFKDALPFLGKVMQGKGSEALKPEAYLKAGLAQYNLDNNNEAIQLLSTLIKTYPQSPESEEAIDNIRSIYVEQGKPDAYVGLLEQLGRKVENSVADSLTYAAAELQLSDGKTPQAQASLKAYLEKYPGGRYSLEANYQLAELLRNAKQTAEAMRYYTAVAQVAPNKYAEKSLLLLSRYHFFDLKDYVKAAAYYQQLKDYASTPANRLEAMRGLVRSQYYQNDLANAVTNARELLMQSGAGSDDKVFANLVLGKQAKTGNNCAEAITYFKQVAQLSKAEFGAEARYQIAHCLLLQNKLADAEKAAFDMIQKSGSYANWVERSYLLLGDVFMQQQDYFNAKATYKSVSENAQQPDVKQEATEKLAKAEAASAAASKMGGQ